MTTIVLNPVFQKVADLCRVYADDSSYVYKVCSNNLVVMQKLISTLTNEDRKVINSKYAKYRASELKVIEIINIHDTNKKVSKIKNNYNGTEIIYELDKIIYPDEYDTSLNVCSHGIHYFKTIEPALFYMIRSYDYTGIHYKWDDDGELLSRIEYLNGVKNGIYTCWNYDGTKDIEGNFVNGKKNGTWTRWSYGKIISKGKYKDDKTIGIWTFCYDGLNRTYQLHSGEYTSTKYPVYEIDFNAIKKIGIIIGMTAFIFAANFYKKSCTIKK
jgi:antitoxin component YwqK of YwqJK toxin-antitoxin module